MRCTVCHSDKTKVKFIKNNYEIIRCPECDHLFTGTLINPEEVKRIYSDDYFFKGGTGYNDYTLQKEILIKRGEYYARKIEKKVSPGTLLDIGAAAGFILKGFENRGWNGLGIEPNESMKEYGVKNLGVNIQTGTIEEFDIKRQFDLITIIQVKAHIFDLHKAMKKIKDLLKPGGYLLIETWNKNSLTARIFGKNWHEYSPPGTLNYFSKKSLDYLCGKYGFSRCGGGRPQRQVLSNHGKSLIKTKFEESEGLRWARHLVRIIPDNILLPYPGDDLFWVLYKKTD